MMPLVELGGVEVVVHGVEEVVLVGVLVQGRTLRLLRKVHTCL